MFPGSAVPINGQHITKLVYETRQTAKDEDAWSRRIDETLDWFVTDDLDFAALYFEQVYLITLLQCIISKLAKVFSPVMYVLS